MPYAKQQITSCNRFIYAEQGEQIAVISKNWDVCICEGKKGRFPVLSEFITDEIPIELTINIPLENLKLAMEAELKKGRTKFKTLVGCIEDGVLNKQMPDGITKELWLLTAKQILS